MQLDQLTQDELLTVLPTTGESATRIISGGVNDKLANMAVEKAQIIRLVDVMVLGPAMLWAGLGKTLPEGLKAVLFLTGVGTIIYNGYNYYQNEALKKQ